MLTHDKNKFLESNTSSYFPSVLTLSLRRGSQTLCQQTTISVNVTAQARIISLEAPKNQSELIALITSFTSMTLNVTTQFLHESRNLTATYDIWILLCLPSSVKPTILEFAIHGSNFDHSYWNFGGEGSSYNYVDATLKAGHAAFIYDRLGVGQSSKPDGIDEVQEDTEIEIAAELIKYIKRGETGHHFQKVIAIGHSFGSVQLTGVAAKYGNLLDGTVLTGFSPYSAALNMAWASFGLTIASQQNKTRFGSLSDSYLATGTISNDQAPFFYFPFFNPNVLELGSATKETSTVGEYLTLSAKIALNYSNPVLVATGDKDYIFCGGNCYQTFAGFENLVSYTQVLFPGVQQFDYFIPANIGHGLNLHYGAGDSFQAIQSWLAQVFG